MSNVFKLEMNFQKTYTKNPIEIQFNSANNNKTYFFNKSQNKNKAASKGIRQMTANITG